MTSVRRCVTCGTTEDVAMDNLCDDCLHARVQRLRSDQGLPPTVEDRDALTRIATIIRRSTSATAAPTNRAQPAVRAGSWDGAAIGAVESERPRLVGEVERGVVRPASGASTAPTRKKNGRPSREASGQSTAPTSPAA